MGSSRFYQITPKWIIALRSARARNNKSAIRGLNVKNNSRVWYTITENYQLLLFYQLISLSHLSAITAGNTYLIYITAIVLFCYTKKNNPS